MSKQTSRGEPMGFRRLGPGMGPPPEKAKHFKQALVRLLALLKPNAWRFVVVFILSMVSTAFVIISPSLVGQAMDMAVQGLMAGKLDHQGLGTLLLWLLFLYLASSAFSFITQWIMSSVSQNTVSHLRSLISQKLEGLPLSYFDTRTHGEILSRVTNDVDTIANTLQQGLTQAITGIIQIMGFIIMMVSISWELTLVVVATLPLYILATMLIAKHSQAYFTQQQKEIGLLSGHLEAMITGHVVVKAFGQEASSIEAFEAINGRLASVSQRANFVSGIIFPAMGFVSNLGYVIISVLGGMWIRGGWLSIGGILAFIQYSRSFSQPINQTATIASVIQSTMACAERVFEILDEQEETPELPHDFPTSPASPAQRGSVELREISFSYKPEAPLMSNLSLKVEPGQIIAIVGPTGAGKTTLVNLLMRFYEVQEGSIHIHGTDITQVSRGALRRNFGMVLQDTWLFHGSIAENIGYGTPQASHEAIIKAAQAAHADHFIQSLPQGYDTIINEEGSNISQGQKQLITIARAILADPQILILDEATSSVDTRTEVLIQKAMAKLMEGRTSFVIAHRLSTIRDAKHILVMNHGSIVEQGTHQGLLDQGGFYHELYQAQFSNSN